MQLLHGGKSAMGKGGAQFGMCCGSSRDEKSGWGRTMFLIKFMTQAAIGVVPFLSNAGGSARTGPVDAKLADNSFPLCASYFDILDMSGFGL